MKFYTVSTIDGTYPTLEEARNAWVSEGKPKYAGSSVWASEYEVDPLPLLRQGVAETLRTITLEAA